MATVERNELLGTRFVWLCARPILRVFHYVPGIGKRMAFRHWGILVSKFPPDEMKTILQQQPKADTILGPLWELVRRSDDAATVSITECFSTAKIAADWSPLSAQLIGWTVKTDEEISAEGRPLEFNKP
jgi:hypothetical protein